MIYTLTDALLCARPFKPVHSLTDPASYVKRLKALYEKYSLYQVEHKMCKYKPDITLSKPDVKKKKKKVNKTTWTLWNKEYLALWSAFMLNQFLKYPRDLATVLTPLYRYSNQNTRVVWLKDPINQTTLKHCKGKKKKRSLHLTALPPSQQPPFNTKM